MADNNDVDQAPLDGKNTSYIINWTLLSSIVSNEEASFYQRPHSEFYSCPQKPKTIVKNYQKDPPDITSYIDDNTAPKENKAFKVNILWSLLDTLPQASDEIEDNLIG